MTKRELITDVAQRLPYLTHRDAQIIVNTIFDSMTDALAQGEGIEIRGFGSFKVKDRGQREGRNPKTGEEIPICARRVVTFRPGQKLKQRVEAYAGSQQ